MRQKCGTDTTPSTQHEETRVRPALWEKERFLFSARRILTDAYRSGLSPETLVRIDIDVEIELIDFAYELATNAHADETRRSGEPYITHPIAVAKIILEDFPNPTSLKVIAALLHDVIENAKHHGVTKEWLLEKFEKELRSKEAQLIEFHGKDDATVHMLDLKEFAYEIVQAVVVLSKKEAKEFLNAGEIVFHAYEEMFRDINSMMRYYANVPLFFLHIDSPTGDVKPFWNGIAKKRREVEYKQRIRELSSDVVYFAILFVKLADRLHNLSTSDGESMTQIEKITLETEEYYVPLALKVDARIAFMLSEEVKRLRELVTLRRASEWIKQRTESLIG